MKLIYRERNRAVEVPWFYGVAWEEDFGHCRVYSVLGLNVVMRWLRLLRWYVGGYPEYDLYTMAEIRSLQKEFYESGYADGYRRARSEMRNDIKQTS